MRRKLLGSAAIVAAAFACVLSIQANAWGVTKQMFRGAPEDPNVYCSGPCGTGSCCVIN